MLSKLPAFSSSFLNDVARRIEDRSKALKRHGELTWDTQQPDDFEWLTVNITPFVGNYCIFQFVEDNRASVYVRSKKRIDRGKILFEFEDFHIVNNALSIIGAIEKTIMNSKALESSDPLRAADAIRTAWSELEVRVSSEQD